MGERGARTSVIKICRVMLAVSSMYIAHQAFITASPQPFESAIDHPISSQHTPIVFELSGHAIRSVGRLRPGRGVNNDEGGLRPGASATEKQDMIHVYIMKTVENRLEAGVKTVDSH